MTFMKNRTLEDCIEFFKDTMDAFSGTFSTMSCGNKYSGYLEGLEDAFSFVFKRDFTKEVIKFLTSKKQSGKKS
jgi:hypothetical protein